MSDLANLGRLLRLARDTISNPREGAVTVLSFAPTTQVLWLMFAIVVVISLLLGEVVALLAELPGNGPLTGPLQNSVISLGLVQAAFLFIMAHAMHRIGRVFGGNGRFEEALLLVIWLQFIFNLLQLVQIGALLIIPPVAGLITILAIALFFWLLVNFVSVLHGFTSLGLVFAMTVVSGFAILFALSLILTMLGLATVPTGGPT
ncbi:YIP1 family protein [Maritalea mobilis]|uniref:Yip1 family protein n=1 Tax=[Roseibacterium] beibuensis TaxID=1193142 RepID=A0ABP9L3V8_9RHOB|nr:MULTISPECIES: Yip1 family protein [Alphaproteobacteria]MBY6200385.1 YIP1 family protein [Maritalea mobilis]MCS6621488.1 YIP1 family protein [Roseibacterium beibuensis]